MVNALGLARYSSPKQRRRKRTLDEIWRRGIFRTISGMASLLTSRRRPNDLKMKREGRRNQGKLRRRRFTCGTSGLVVVIEAMEESTGIGSASITLSLTSSLGYTTSPWITLFTKEVLNVAKIVRFLWPPQSPDMNPIEQIWKYRKQIRKRRLTGEYP
jgi:hypothetical protein